MKESEIVYVVYSNEMRCKVIGIFKSYKKAENFIKRSDGLAMDLIEQFPVIE
jgi:hypothetical protein